MARALLAQGKISGLQGGGSAPQMLLRRAYGSVQFKLILSGLAQSKSSAPCLGWLASPSPMRAQTRLQSPPQL